MERPRRPDQTELEDDMRRDGGGSGNATEGGDDGGVCELGLGEQRARERAAGRLGWSGWARSDQMGGRSVARSDQVEGQIGGSIRPGGGIY